MSRTALRTWLAALTGGLALILSGSALAHDGEWRRGYYEGGPGPYYHHYHRPPPVYYAPPPVVYSPPTYRYAPAPVVYQPAPVYQAPVYQPAPVYYSGYRRDPSLVIGVNIPPVVIPLR